MTVFDPTGKAVTKPFDCLLMVLTNMGQPFKAFLMVALSCIGSLNQVPC